MLSPTPALMVVGAAAFVGQPLERAFVRHQGTAAYHDQILGPKIILVHGFVEFYPACSLSLLPQLACNILATT